MPRGATFRDPPEALITSATASSGVAVALGDEPRAIVHLELHLRRNHSAERYTARLALDPALADELTGILAGAAKASRRDLRRYLKTGDDRG